MELTEPSAALQFRRDLVDAFRYDQHGSVGGLGEKVAQRPVQASREQHAIPLLRYQRERPVNLQGGTRLGGEEPTLGVRFAAAPKAERLRTNQVNDAGDWVGAHDGLKSWIATFQNTCCAEHALVRLSGDGAGLDVAYMQQLRLAIILDNYKKVL